VVLDIYEHWADVIFNKLYRVTVPVLATYSQDELDIVGIPLNVIDDVKHDSHEQRVEVMIPIVDMVEKFNNGFRVAVINSEDVDEIYDVINKHLSAWRDHSVVSLNQTAMPTEDLILLDKFASEIFSLNKRTIVDKTVVRAPAFSGNFNALMMRENPIVKQEIDYDSVERESIAPKNRRKSKYDLNTLLM